MGPKSKYVLVKCECGNEQPVFTHTSTVVKCQKCGAVLATPRGGKADIKAKIVKELK